jgi:hypothetical protein
MSKYLTLTAEIPIKYLRTGEATTIRQSFPTWELPDAVLHSILDSRDPINTYCEWVLSISVSVKVAHYAHDDPLEEGSIIGYSTYNEGQEHVADLWEWMWANQQIGDIKVGVE